MTQITRLIALAPSTLYQVQDLSERTGRTGAAIVRIAVERMYESQEKDMANKTKPDLRAADLREVDMGKADLSGAYLSEANLRGANLYDADLSGADLSFTNLSGVNLRWAKYDDETIWPEGIGPINSTS